MSALRNLSGMFLSAVIFLSLKKDSDLPSLQDYAWFVLLGHLAVTLAGWGIKDYSFKAFARNMYDLQKEFSLQVSARLFLLLLIIPFIFLLNFSLDFKLLLAAWIIFRILVAAAEPLILFYRVPAWLPLFETLAYLLAAVMIFRGSFSLNVCLGILVGLEFLKLLMSSILVFQKKLYISRVKPFVFLLETRSYFLVALLSFLISRVDVYVLGVLRSGQDFSYYNIIVNLISVSQVVISSYYNNRVKGIFRLHSEEAKRILNALVWQFLALSIMAVFCIYLIMNFIYQISLPADLYLLLALNVLAYCFTIKSLYMLSHFSKWNLFVLPLLTSFGVGLIASVLLVPSLSMRGSLIANTVSALLLAVLLHFSVNKAASISKPL